MFPLLSSSCSVLSEAPLFDLRFEAAVPADKSIGTVKEQFSDLAGEMNLDLVFKV
jgi:glycine cleavage system regulatory protein